jgi:glycosyltransferase involved in cell wall biosynthesis
MNYPINKAEITSNLTSSKEILLNNINESIQFNSPETKSKYKCIPTDKKIFWKNQIDFGLEKSIEEVRNSESLKISFDNIHDFYKRENPKISIIITVYNQGYYIEELYAHIQLQEFKDLEIIFVDDASTDNSSLIIKQLMNRDKRIIYLKNEINKRQYYSITKGILKSKGEYILSIDADDFLLNNILVKAYETAKYYDLDIVQYYMLVKMEVWQVKYKSGIMCNNKDIRNIYYYGITRNLPDKLIKRDIYISSINFMKKDFYYQDYHMHTDDTFFFGIIHFANSYGFLEQIGYYYNNSPSRNKRYKIIEDNKKIINGDLKSLFSILYNEIFYRSI